jgi:hypothetical protein
MMDTVSSGNNSFTLYPSAKATGNYTYYLNQMGGSSVAQRQHHPVVLQSADF